MQRDLVRGKYPTRCRPHVGKGVFDVDDRRAPYGNASVAPRVGAAGRRTAPPHVADTESGDEPDTAIAANQLPVIARQPSQRRVEPRLIERTHVHARAAQSLPEHPRCGRERAEPIVNDADLDAASRGCTQGGGELTAAFI